MSHLIEVVEKAPHIDEVLSSKQHVHIGTYDADGGDLLTRNGGVGEDLGRHTTILIITCPDGDAVIRDQIGQMELIEFGVSVETLC